MAYKHLAKLSLVIFSVFLLSFCFISDRAIAQTSQDAAPTCRVGAYITNLNQFNLADQTFNAEMWIWGVCPNQDLNPLDTMEFVNAQNIKISNYSLTVREKDVQQDFPDARQIYWHSEKVQGTFEHDWDVRNIPFDRHTLRLTLEEAEYDSSEFQYTADIINSNTKEGIEPNGWKIKNVQIFEDKNLYNTTFGDPKLNNSQSSYTRINILLDLRRTSVTSFFKLHIVVYIGFIISLVAYYLDTGISDLAAIRVSCKMT